MTDPPPYDVIIIGGGVAGLSAALVLGRCCRRVLVLDEGKPRNRRSKAMHGFPGVDGIDPATFLATCRKQLAQYDVDLVAAKVSILKQQGEGFVVETAEGHSYESDFVLLAIGVVDRLPDLPGIDRYYATSVHHCPICDGWEHRGKRLAAYGTTPEACGLALELKIWSDHVVLCTNGAFTPDAEQKAKLVKAGISTFAEPIAQLVGNGEHLHKLVGKHGGRVHCDALFFVSDTFTPVEFFQDLETVNAPNADFWIARTTFKPASPASSPPVIPATDCSWPSSPPPKAPRRDGRSTKPYLNAAENRICPSRDIYE